jgi:hypothetical protein
MSYNLYFKPRQGTLSEDAFWSYFEGKANYTRQGAQAIYDNENTGVYFDFLFDLSPLEEDEGPASDCPVMLTVNYMRPGFFIQEAEREVSALVKHFDFLVLDPQSDEKGPKNHQTENMIKTWHEGNQFSVSVRMSLDESSREHFFWVPRELLQSTWAWNFSIEERYANATKDLFLPRIFLGQLEEQIITFACWPDGLPSHVPKVDYLWVPRKNLAPRKFFKKQEDTTFVAWHLAEPVLMKHGQLQADGSIELGYLDKPPAEVVKFVRNLPLETRTFQGFASDQTLELELCPSETTR